MAPNFQQANLFELNGGGIQITYSSTSIGGTPLLSYRKASAGINRQFSGEEIRCVETELGELITVTLEHIPDLHIVTFTLILPAVNVMQGSVGTNIRVPGITTTTLQTLVPMLGQQKTYSQAKLRGTAQAVSF